MGPRCEFWNQNMDVLKLARAEELLVISNDSTSCGLEI